MIHNIYMKILVVIFLTVIFGGCATTPKPQLSRDEQLQISSRVYENKSKEEVLAAAEKLFKLSDGDDYKFFHSESGFYATRNWSVYLVLAAARGTDYWTLTTNQTKEGTSATIQLNTQTQTITPTATTDGAWTASSSTMPGQPIEGTAIYDIFWSRMDYLLGKNKEWMSCKTSDKKVKDKIVWGSNEALCNSFNVLDLTP